MKKKILDKLGLTERGAKNILSNNSLCERILKEDVIEVKQASIKYDIPFYALKLACRQNKLSYISNGGIKKGRKTFVFVSEIEDLTINKSDYNTGKYYVLSKFFKASSILTDKIFNENESNVLKKYIDGETTKAISIELSLSTARISDIINKALIRYVKYIKLLSSLDEASKLNDELKYENRRLSKLNIDLRHKISKSEVVQDSFAYEKIHISELGASTRLVRLLRYSLELRNVFDIIKFLKIRGLNHVSKCRDAGAKTVIEFYEIIYKILKENNTEEALRNDIKKFINKYYS